MGSFWTAWNRKMEPMLLDSQLADGVSWEEAVKHQAVEEKMLRFTEPHFVP